MEDATTHSDRRLSDPGGWVLYVSRVRPARLVVFLHGFAGAAVHTWQRFPDGARSRAWWRESDLLFVGYPSEDNITATAARLIRHLPRFFPRLPEELVEVGGVRVRPPPECDYRQLILVGHSLGGLVIRRALSDAADEWVLDGKTNPRPGLLGAEVRLFSPASAGFRPAGLLGMVHATRIWGPLRMILHSRSSFTDLQPGSPVLADTRRRTESLVAAHPELAALRARIVWANPDKVVLTERYDTDHRAEVIDGTSHRSVCKPGDDFADPWRFVEHGRLD